MDGDNDVYLADVSDITSSHLYNIIQFLERKLMCLTFSEILEFYDKRNSIVQPFFYIRGIS